MEFESGLNMFRYAGHSRKCVFNSLRFNSKAPVTPNGDATAFVQRSKPCQRALGSPRNTHKNRKEEKNKVVSQICVLLI